MRIGFFKVKKVVSYFSTKLGSLFIFLREGELVDRAKALKVNVGTEPSADLGPVITKEVNTSFCIMCQFFL